jgi:hypothetical protein
MLVVDRVSFGIHDPLILPVVFIDVLEIEFQPVLWQGAYYEVAIVGKDIAAMRIYGHVAFEVLLFDSVPIVALNEHYYGSLAYNNDACQCEKEHNQQIESQYDIRAELEHISILKITCL